MQPLHIKANPQGWREFMARKQEDVFLKIAKKVFKRDQLECQYCGVRMTDAEVVNKNGSYTNNRLTNLVTACPLCAQCGFLESVNIGVYGGGTLIYLPEIDQASLNALCYQLFKAMQENTDQEEAAEEIYRNLSVRAQLVETHLGDGMSDPAVFGQLMIESEHSFEGNTLVADLRLLPIRAAFKEYIAHNVVS